MSYPMEKLNFLDDREAWLFTPFRRGAGSSQRVQSGFSSPAFPGKLYRWINHSCSENSTSGFRAAATEDAWGPHQPARLRNLSAALESNRSQNHVRTRTRYRHPRHRLRRTDRRHLHCSRQPQAAGARRPRTRRPALHHHPGRELPRLARGHPGAAAHREHETAGCPLRRRVPHGPSRLRRSLEASLRAQRSARPPSTRAL